jgi:acetylornithine deacetylase/succinyl-diaminopimelate desuccinylase-like protein
MISDWGQVRDEVTGILVDLIRINTTNPPGNETEAAVYIQELLNREGIKSTIYESGPKRANLVARIEGSGQSRPLVLLSHLDVVGANPGQWSHPPFAAEIADDYVWGRGALDMKNMAAMELVSMIRYQRSREIPNRDLILVAAADEEVGGIYGMEWLIKQAIPGLENAEYIINEGGEGIIRQGVPVYACQNGEKGILWVKLSVRGTPGHASMPSKDNAIARMAKILNKIGRYKQPMTLCETTRGYISEMAKLTGTNFSTASAGRDYSLKIYAGRHFKNERSVQAMLYNTISPTIIRAGEKTNVLPEVCEATLDCRLLPGETPEHFLEKLESNTNDSSVSFEVIQAAAPTESAVDTELFKVMQKAVRTENPQSLVVPYLSPGGTDSRFFRKKGITAYGFVPIILPESELQRMHGVDERISLKNLEQGTRILYNVISDILRT